MSACKQKKQPSSACLDVDVQVGVARRVKDKEPHLVKLDQGGGA